MSITINRRDVLAGGLAVMAAPMVARAQTQSLRLWHVYNLDTEVMMKEGIRTWNEANPALPIQERIVPFAQLRAELVRAVSTGEVPDVVTIDNPVLASFAAEGALVDLSSRIAASGVIKPASFHPGPWSTCQWRGKTYGVPRDSNTIAIYVNRDMLKAKGLNPPKTWAELRTAAAQLTDASKRIFGFAFSAIQSEEGTFQFLPFLQQAGGSLSRIDGPEAIEALTLWRDLVKSGHSPREVISIRQSEATNQLIAGNAAMAMSGPWDLPRVVREAKFDWGVALLPVRGDGKTIAASALGGANWAIPEGSKNVDGAFRLIEHMTRPEQMSRAWLSGRLPPRADVTIPNPSTPEAFAVFNEQMKSASPRGPHPQWPDISRAVQIALQEALTETATVEAALKKAASTINPILARTPL